MNLSLDSEPGEYTGNKHHREKIKKANMETTFQIYHKW